MFIAITLALITGVFWALNGIAISKSADEHFDMRAFGLLQTALTALALLILTVHLQRDSLTATLIIAAIILTGGILNATTQFVIKRLMQTGHHGPIWTIAHAALVVPFIVGVLVWREHSSWPQWLGTAVIAMGVLVIARGQATPQEATSTQRSPAGRFNWALLLPFILVAVTQTLFSTPSRLENLFPDLHDSSNVRPFCTTFGATLGWLAIRATQPREPFQWSPKIVRLALAMTVLQTISLFVFYLSMDKTRACGLGNACIPLIIGSNIGCFSLYRIIFCHENTNGFEKAGVGIIVAGMASIALSCWF